jgi:hypothetical protein
VAANVAEAVVAGAEGAKSVLETDAMNKKIKTEEKHMKSHKNNLTSGVSAQFPAVILLAVLCTASCSVKKPAETTARPSPTVFAKPEEAGQALRSAATAKDENGLAKIMGPGSEAIFHSGDTAEDQATLDSFVAKYDRMNRWVTMTDGSKVLYIGADNYPTPRLGKMSFLRAASAGTNFWPSTRSRPLRTRRSFTTRSLTMTNPRTSTHR